MKAIRKLMGAASAVVLSAGLVMSGSMAVQFAMVGALTQASVGDDGDLVFVRGPASFCAAGDAACDAAAAALIMLWWCWC
jgi:hypothetical protein